MTLLTVLAAMVFGVAAGAPAATTPDDDSSVALLKESGVAIDAAGLAGYLKTTMPGEEQRKAVAALVEQLGDDDYATREAATKRLIAMPNVPADELEKGRRSADPEIRLRIETVISQRTGTETGMPLILAALHTISRRHVGGMAATLLEFIPLHQDEVVLIAGREALVATSRAEDAGLLREASKSEKVELRVAATMALATVLGDKAREELAGVLNGPDGRTRVAVGWSLANRGDRACLGPLVEMLSSNDPRTRQAAYGVLRPFTGQTFGYAAYDPPVSQEPAIKAWREWVGKEGATAQLFFPLKPTVPELGRTLICDYSGNRVLELDARDQTVWTLNMPGPWGCQGLPDGHRLICCYPQQTVFEYDAAGKECWKRASLPGNPISVQRLENGNTLISLSDGGKVVEVRRDGQITWEVTLQGRPTDARRLDDGRTLITLDYGKRVIEVDRAGKEVWQLQCQSSPSNALRLENGNTLVTERGANKVVEYSRQGKVVWEREGFANAVDIQRLGDGTTLIGDSGGVKQIDAKGNVVWKKDVGSARVYRY